MSKTLDIGIRKCEGDWVWRQMWVWVREVGAGEGWSGDWGGWTKLLDSQTEMGKVESTRGGSTVRLKRNKIVNLLAVKILLLLKYIEQQSLI